jgi:chemosensory pili system protein ChpA (sensor histidine kinase/response regulator)
MASEHGKQAELTLQGGGNIDRQVLEKMLAPMEHMLRNAVIHGIETPAQRKKQKKPAVGKVVINVRREGSQVVIEINDDGKGMDADMVRRKAVDLGILNANDEVPDEEVLQFVLRPGFSTAARLTQASGRGIGMDVVASEVAKLGGTLRIDTRQGEGTRISIRLPFTLAVTQALVVRAANELYALPLPTVEGIIRISSAEFKKKMSEDEPAIMYGDQTYRLRYLGQFLGLGAAVVPEDEERISIILVRAMNNSTALVTDEMLDSREIIVKPVGKQLATIRGITGATILGDGQIAIILDASALVSSAAPVIEPIDLVSKEEDQQPVALVVDDSITMRRVSQRLLERNGMRVLTAKDGLEAVGVLRDHRPDIILLDVEMPRMDGYEFAALVRNNEQTEDVPIIMITSRVSDEHRARAIELGVNDYLGKPYQETVLLDAVQQLLKID